ncbi:MAG: autotransporter-associated beta strand repeat-containing protein [Pirellulales bacterium]
MLGATQQNFNIENVTAVDVDLEISSIISSTGAGIVKTGTGLLKLSGTNSYTGATQLNAGVIEAGSLANLSTASTSIIFNGGTLRWATGSSFDVSARSTTFTGAATFNTNGNNVTLASSVGQRRRRRPDENRLRHARPQHSFATELHGRNDDHSRDARL